VGGKETQGDMKAATVCARVPGNGGGRTHHGAKGMPLHPPTSSTSSLLFSPLTFPHRLFHAHPPITACPCLLLVIPLCAA